VLSESTEDFDRTIKFKRLQDFNPSMTDYLLVSQDEPRIEHHTRQADGVWSCQVYKGLDARIAISSIGCTLSLAEVYDRVVFEPR
jgi:hypothetical protein